MKVTDKEVLILIVKCHKRPTHDNVLYLVHRVSQLLQLEGRGKRGEGEREREGERGEGGGGGEGGEREGVVSSYQHKYLSGHN